MALEKILVLVPKDSFFLFAIVVDDAVSTILGKERLATPAKEEEEKVRNCKAAILEIIILAEINDNAMIRMDGLIMEQLINERLELFSFWIFTLYFNRFVMLSSCFTIVQE